MVETLVVVWQGTNGSPRASANLLQMPSAADTTRVGNHQGIWFKLICGKLAHSPQASTRG
jgi:hypothetical protein